MTHHEPRLFDEDFARRALVPILTKDSTLPVGTGAFVGPDGEVLTCYHVVAPHLKMGLEIRPYGAADPVPVELDHARSAPDLDLAVLRGPTPPAVLPCGGRCATSLPVWTIGFQHHSDAIVGALPSNGRLGGSLDELRLFGTKLRAYVLENMTVSPGLSGAPLLDRETGVVVGLVTAEFLDDRATAVSGFALPLDMDAMRGTPVEALLATNRDTIPAYGRHLNHLGALQLCHRQRSATLTELKDAGIFLPHIYCDRELDKQVTGFLNGPSRILPVVGHSGVGKSSLLCALANHSTGPVLLVRANSVDYGPGKGLPDTLKGAFGPDWQFVHDLPALLDAVNGDLIVLFDGLNEVTQFDLPAVKAWLERTTPWLRQQRVRWIITSRPEYWQHLKRCVPEDLVYQAPTLDERPNLASRLDGIALNNFSAVEGQDAMARYGLASLVPDSPLFLHPFMMRVCWEMLRRGGPVRTGRYDLLESFARGVCDRVAGQPNIYSSSRDVFSLLSDLGRFAGESGTNSLRLDQVNGLVPRESPLRKALRDQHMLEQGANEFRFAFDEMAEFFIAQSRAASELNTCPNLGAFLDHLTSIAAGALRLAVLRAERDDPPQAGAAVKRMAGEAPVNGFTGPAFVARLFADLANPVAQFDSMRTYLTRKVTDAPRDYRATRLILVEWPRLKSPTQNLELLRLLFREANSHPYRRKDWTGLTQQQFFQQSHGTADYSLAGRVRGEIEAEPEVALDGLLAWLGDDAPLEQHEATVADAAAAFLVHYRDRFFDRLCDAVVALPHDVAYWLLKALVTLEPDRFLAVLGRWSVAPGPPDRLILEWAGESLDVELPTREAALTPILQRLHTRTPVGSSDYWLAIRVMVSCPTLRDGLFSAVAEGLRREPPALPISIVNFYRRTRLAEVLDLLDPHLNSEVISRQGQALALLWNWCEPAACAAAVERLARFVPCRDELASNVGLTIERLLYHVPTALPERAALVELAGRALREASPNCRAPIAYFISEDSKDPVKRREQAELTALALTTESNDRILGCILQPLAQNQKDFGRLLEVLQPLAQRLPPDDFADLVRHAVFDAHQHEDASYRATIVAWASSATDTVTTSLLSDVRQLLQQPGDRAQAIRDYFNPYSAYWRARLGDV